MDKLIDELLKLQNNILDLLKENKKLQEENEYLKKEKKKISQQHIYTLDKLIETQTKIENTIEYIKSKEFVASDGEICYICNMKVIKDTLNILGGK